MASLESGPELSPLMKPLAWLLGKWRSTEAQASYPTMTNLAYEEELEFFHTGQPNIQFNFNSWNPDTKQPMHKETGFIRKDPNSNTVAIIAAMNLGACTIEEGTVDGETISTESHTVGRLTFGKEPATKKVCRTFKLNGDTLELVVLMETSKSPLQEHLRVKYKKV